MNAAEQRGGRYVLWGARARDVQISGEADRHISKAALRQNGRPRQQIHYTKRGKRVGW